MFKTIVIEPDVELQVIAESADELANAEYELAYLESLKPAIKALQMKESKQPNIAGKEMDAFASEEYQTWVNNYATAKKRHTTVKLKIETAKLKLDLYRTQEATSRFINKSMS